MNKQRKSPPGARVPRSGGQGVIVAGHNHREAVRAEEQQPPMAQLSYGEANSFLRGAAKPDATRVDRKAPKRKAEAPARPPRGYGAGGGSAGGGFGISGTAEEWR